MTKLTKITMSTIALAASTTMLLAGCGTTKTGNNTGTGNTTTSQNTPKNGGQIVIGQTTAYDDELLPDMDASLYTANIVSFAYDPLLNIDKNLNFVPGLAKSWDWSQDKKTLTMHLQPNANWSDGQPITSDDVLFTLNYLGSKTYNTTLQGQYGYLVSSLKGASDILAGKATSFASTGGFTKVDDKTFELHFNTVDAAALYSQISSIQPLPEHILKNTPMKSWTTASEDKTPTVVSGPYTFTKVTGTDSVEMKANPTYWQGKPHIDTIIFKTVNQDVAPGLLSQGSVDFMLNGLKPADVSKLKTINNIAVKTLPENGFSYLGLKLYQKEFQDVKVRQAFEYALDRQTMVQGIEKGLGQVVNGPLPPVSWAAATSADGMNSYDYSTDKANQLLDAAGWTKGANGVRIDPVTKQPANLHLDYSSGSASSQAMAVAIQQDLAKVGVKVTLDTPLDFNTLANKVENDDPKMQMWLMSWSLSTDPDPRGLWQSTDAFNFERWKDPKNDALIAKTYDSAAFDQTDRKQALVQWQLYANQQLPLIFLFAPDDVWAYSNKLNIPANDWSVAGPLNVQDWWVN